VIRDNSLFSSDSGAVLIVVLGILALLTVMAVSFVFATRLSLRASESYLRTITATDIAEAGAAAAIYTLRADKMFRTGDLEDPTVTPTQTYDSLRDLWRQRFSAPVVLQYEYAPAEPSFDFDSPLPIIVTNTSPYDTTPYRQDVSANVLAIDTGNNRLYIDSASTALWKYTDASNRDTITVWQDSTLQFSAPLAASPSKPNEVDLDDDGTNDAVWHNYYDENGDLIGRYAVLIQDESSKININVSGNLSAIGATANDYTTYNHASNEGWSTFEISIENGLNTTGFSSTPPAHKKIVLYRNGLAGALSGATLTAGDAGNRIYAAGQGDLDATTYDAANLNDDDDNFNRFFYGHDGIDNDGDGKLDYNDGFDNDGDGFVDEKDEAPTYADDDGMNEPEEFRPLRPFRERPGVVTNLDYDTLDNDADGITDETNEADDQPILALEQLEDAQGVSLSGFLAGTVSTNFDGATNTSIERRNFISTLSFDRDLTRDNELRINYNFSTPEQNAAALHRPFPATGPGDTNAFERVDLRNMQVAANICDYRDRNRSRTEIRDAAGNVFAGVEAIRINEILVRAATNLYEGEHPDLVVGTPNNWDRVDPPTGATDGAITPRGQEAYLTNDGSTPNINSEVAGPITITLPDPPFDTGTTYPFKLRMRVSNDEVSPTDANDKGFRVWIQDGNGKLSLVVNRTGDPTTLGQDSDAASSPIFFTVTGNPNCRWATSSTAAAAKWWYIEEASGMLDELGTTTTLNLTGGDNLMWLEKPVLATAGNQDSVDLDWFYFTLEPDCEWIELVNIGDRPVNVNNWKLTSEYIVDWPMVSTSPNPLVWTDLTQRYYSESYQLTLPNVTIHPVSGTTWPKHAVFALDDDGVGGPSDSVGLYFSRVWSDVPPATVFGLASISNIYSAQIDFFGNEPLDNPFDNSVARDVRGTSSGVDDIIDNIDIGVISLYDTRDNLVDRVTYDSGNVTEAFASLQRDHPANPGDRLDQNENFKMRAYTASGVLTDNNVVADGNYDDWKFYNDPWLTNNSIDGSLSTAEFIGYTPNSRGSRGFMTPGEANNRSDNYDERVATPEGRVKDRYFVSPGEMGRMAGFNEFIAIVGYDQTLGDDTTFAVGDRVVNTTKDPDQTATILAIDTTDRAGNSGAPDGWMVLRGDYQNPVNTWQGDPTNNALADDIQNFAGTFEAQVRSVKAFNMLPIRFIDYDVEIGYSLDTGSDPVAGDTIRNTSKATTETATAMEVDTVNDIIQLRMNPTDPTTEWKVGESIDNGASPSFTGTITSVRTKSAYAGGLADYFTTSFLDLEAEAATAVINAGSPTAVRWPASHDPQAYLIPAGADLTLTWDEDDGVQPGTYDLYSFVNYGTTIQSEVPVYVGPVTVAPPSFGQQATVSLTIQNTAASAATYYYLMRAALTPAPQTFGRINVNTASHMVLQGLPGIDSTLAGNIITARNMAAFESIGDLYRTAEVSAAFTPTKFKNVSNLVTTRSDVYKIVVIGQSVIDANDDGLITSDEVTSTKKMEVIYQR
jgi:hypothetical protein